MMTTLNRAFRRLASLRISLVALAAVAFVAAWNPAVAWEWRGAVTVGALHTLRAYGRLR